MTGDRRLFQSSIAPKSDRNLRSIDTFSDFVGGSNPRSPRRATAIKSSPEKVSVGMVPILDRPEERPQLEVVYAEVSKGVPILDRPEERPQFNTL